MESIKLYSSVLTYVFTYIFLEYQLHHIALKYLKSMFFELIKINFFFNEIKWNKNENEFAIHKNKFIKLLIYARKVFCII